MSRQTVIIWKKDLKEMVYIPSGGFPMGTEESLSNEGPPHTLHLDAFYMDRYPVTNAEYKRFVDATDHPVPCYEVDWVDTRGYNWDPDTRTPPEGKEKHPVVLVSWEDARAYAAWAGKRLPTEAEWERAARSTDGRRWPWGDEFVQGRCNSKESGVGGTTPVGQYSVAGDSPDGVGDMVGNVWEWTSTLFRPYPYDADDGRESQEASGWRLVAERPGSSALYRPAGWRFSVLQQRRFSLRRVGGNERKRAQRVPRDFPQGLWRSEAAEGVIVRPRILCAMPVALASDGPGIPKSR